MKEPNPGEGPSDRIRQALEKVEAKYTPNELDKGRMRVFLSLWNKKLGGLSGKRILDVGCGSKESADVHTVSPGTYEPWVCRALHEAGAEAVGIDIGTLAGEEFEHYEKDILAPDTYAFFADESFDGVSASSLFDSPALFHRALSNDVNKAREIFMKEATRILRPGGVLVIAQGDFRIWRKIDGVLVPEKYRTTDSK